MKQAVTVTPRVLIVQPIRAVAKKLADYYRTRGHDVVVADSVQAASAAPGSFEHGVFALDLDDGSGIVLAASMQVRDRLRKVTFVHPDDAHDMVELESSPYGLALEVSDQVA